MQLVLTMGLVAISSPVIDSAPLIYDIPAIISRDPPHRAGILCLISSKAHIVSASRPPANCTNLPLNQLYSLPVIAYMPVTVVNGQL